MNNMDLITSIEQYHAIMIRHHIEKAYEHLNEAKKIYVEMNDHGITIKQL